MRLIRVFFRTFLSNRSWDSFDCYESTPETCCFKPYSFRCIISKLTTIQWRQKDKSHTCALNRSLTISVIFKKKEVHKLYTHDIKRVLNNIYIFPSYMFTYIYESEVGIICHVFIFSSTKFLIRIVDCYIDNFKVVN